MLIFIFLTTKLNKVAKSTKNPKRKIAIIAVILSTQFLMLLLYLVDFCDMYVTGSYSKTSLFKGNNKSIEATIKMFVRQPHQALLQCYDGCLAILRAMISVWVS